MHGFAHLPQTSGRQALRCLALREWKDATGDRLFTGWASAGRSVCTPGPFP
jgi:hypothetical protein